MNKDGNPSEHEEQCTLIKWCEFRKVEHPELAWVFAVPNGGHRHIATASQLRAEGARAGVPDLFLDVARTMNGVSYHGLRIEMKVKGNKPTEAQVAWIEHFNEEGYFATVCYGWLDAARTIAEYLGFEDEDIT